MSGLPDNRGFGIVPLCNSGVGRAYKQRQHFIDLYWPITMQYVESEVLEILSARLEDTLSCLCEPPLLLATRLLHLRGVPFASMRDLYRIYGNHCDKCCLYSQSHVCLFYRSSHLHYVRSMPSQFNTRKSAEDGMFDHHHQLFPTTQAVLQLHSSATSSSRTFLITLDIPSFKIRGDWDLEVMRSSVLNPSSSYAPPLYWSASAAARVVKSRSRDRQLNYQMLVSNWKEVQVKNTLCSIPQIDRVERGGLIVVDAGEDSWWHLIVLGILLHRRVDLDSCRGVLRDAESRKKRPS